MDFFNNNAGAIQSITTLILVIITGIYVYITASILKANKESNSLLQQESELARRPYILVTLDFRGGVLVTLVIKNVGKSIAEDVNLSLDKDIFILGDQAKNLKDYPVFKKPIKHFMPDMEYKITLGQSWLFFDSPEQKAVLPDTFQVNAEYSYFNKRVKETNIIDFGSFQDTLAVKGELPEELEKLRKEIVNELHQIKNKIPE